MLLTYTIGWYNGKGMASFKEKLAQFPPGSQFRIVTTKAEMDANKAEFAATEEAASANGLRIDVLSTR